MKAPLFLIFFIERNPCQISFRNDLIFFAKGCLEKIKDLKIKPKIIRIKTKYIRLRSLKSKICIISSN